MPKATTTNSSVGTVPVRIANRARSRKGLIITNTGTVNAFLGNDNDVTASTGYALLPGLSLVSTSDEAWYAVSTGSGTTLSMIED